MPRGVYDRTKKNEKLPKAAMPKMSKSTKVVKSHVGRNILAGPGMAQENQFAVLTSNVLSLGQIRGMSLGETITKRVDAELLQNINALRTLRQQVFGRTVEEMEETVQTVPSNGSLPLPAKPLIPVPPIPQS